MDTMRNISTYDKSAWRYLFSALSILTISLYMVIASISPMNGEDYALTRIFGDEGFWDRLSWVINRSNTQIAGWNARLGEQLAIFWLSMPEIYFLIASVLGFVFFNLLVSSVHSGMKGIAEKTTISICLIFLCWPGMEVFFWRTANAGYFQPMILTLICIYFYSDEKIITNLSANKFKLIGVSIAAFLSGLSFENTPVAVAFYMLASFAFLTNKKKNAIALLPVGAMILGWLILISAASTTARRSYYANVYGVTGYSFEYIVNRAHEVVKTFYATTSPLLVASILALTYVLIYSENRKRVLLTTVPAILVVGSLVAAPYTEPRSFLLAWALMLATVVEAAYIASKNIRYFGVFALAIFLVSFSYQIQAYQIYFDFARLVNDRDFFIKRKVGMTECTTGIEVKRIQTSYNYKFLNNRDDWFHGNPGFVSRYYNCNIVMK